MLKSAPQCDYCKVEMKPTEGPTMPDGRTLFTCPSCGNQHFYLDREESEKTTN